MFSLHYFFKDKESIDNLITNISSNISDNGYVIGACFNGNKIFDYLKDLKMNDSVSDFKEGNTIWRIIKKYADTKFENNDESLGMSIQVYMYSIHKVIEEYLVNFDYFKTKLIDHNIDILESGDMNNMMLPKVGGNKSSIGGFEDVFNSLIMFSQNEKYKAQFNINTKLYNSLSQTISDGEKTISFFSTYFIFKKRTGKSLTLDIRQFILDNQNTTGYKTHFKNNKWIKLKKRVFKDYTNVELIKGNDLHENAYEMATARITTDRQLVKVKKLIVTKQVIKPTLIIDKALKSKRPKLKISKNKKTSANSKTILGRNKIKGLIKMINTKIENKSTKGLSEKIDTIIIVFKKSPYNTDDEINKGIIELELLKAELK